MREGWTYKKLGEVCDFQGGSQPPKDEWIKEYKDGYIRMLQIRDFTQDDTAYIEYVKITPRLKVCKKDDILIARYGASVGKLLTGLEGAYNVAIIKTIPNEEIISKNFIHRFFESIYFQSILLHVSKDRAAQAGFSKDDIYDTIIPIPPLSEQEVIVSELDKINELISLKKAQLSDLDNLAQSIFYEMFGDPVENENGWEVKKLSENVQEMFLGPFGSALKIDSYVPKENSFCMVYEQKHAIQGRLDLDNHFVNKEKYESLKRFEVKGGDFIMSCRGTIGRLFQLPINAPLGIIHPSLMKIRIKTEIYDATYFSYMLVKIVANENTNGNCVQMAITAKELGKKELPLPPLSLQQSFAARIEAIEKQKGQISATIKDLETLLASRMQYWFE